jgi:zinc dependent phospholipase C
VPEIRKTSRCRAFMVLLLAFFVLLVKAPSRGYSILTHEQVVDLLWESNLKPLLLKRYPQSTAEQLRQAHAYAYGGCLIQDMGYYPGGNKFFSDLVHYVRSGDFVLELVRQAQNVNELAFALGALAHYVSDNNGHPTINRAVPKEFPKLQKKFGDVITYSDDPPSHLQTEFGFDVLEVAKRRYTSQAYHDFIGFNVAQLQLERAFAATYGLDLRKVFPDEDRAIGSYRRAVSKWMPRLTQAALIIKKDELKAIPNFNADQFRYTLKRAEYEREWGNNYYHPGFFAKVIAVLVKVLPKIGPLRVADPKPPTPETEKMYLASMEQTVSAYRTDLNRANEKRLVLIDDNLDTGTRSFPGNYKLADRTYARILEELARRNFADMPPELRTNLLAFYSDLNLPFETKQHKSNWKRLLHNLDELKKQQPAVAEQKSAF